MEHTEHLGIKYEFTDEQKMLDDNTVVHRIRAIRDFGDVTRGTLGGWIENKLNLSHDGNCWVYHDAIVSGNARIENDATIRNNSRVYGDASIIDNVVIEDNSIVFGAYVCGDSIISNNTRVIGSAFLNNTTTYDNAYIHGDGVMIENSCIASNARVHGVAHVCNAYIGTDGDIKKPSDYIVVGPVGSRDGFTTAYKSVDRTVRIQCGCFNGTLQEFARKVEKTYGRNSVYHKKTAHYYMYKTLLSYLQQWKRMSCIKWKKEKIIGKDVAIHGGKRRRNVVCRR